MQTIDFAQLKLQPQQRVLDLGCGEGRHSLYAHHFSDAGLVVGLDINIADVQQARERDRDFATTCAPPKSHYMVADGAELPFTQDCFDVVICSEVLEHIEHYEAVLAEIERVLKPEGKLAISVPRRWPEQICWWLSDAYHRVEGGHVRIFKERELRRQICALNFSFVKRHWAHALHSPYWWLKCLLWKQQGHSRILKTYHRFLVWDLMHKPWFSQTLERLSNPLCGKSVVLYFVKGPEKHQ